MTPPGCSAGWCSAIVLVTDVSAYLGEFGDPFDERDPTAFTITAHYPNPGSLERILAAVDEELARIAADGLEAGELDRVRTRTVSVLFREMDAVMSRTLEFAKFELIFGRAELIAELPGPARRRDRGRCPGGRGRAAARIGGPSSN